MEKGIKVVILLLVGSLATLTYGQAEPLDVIIWSENFQGFDPCTTDPCFSGDLPSQDETWRNFGADATQVVDESFILTYFPEDFWPDPEEIPFTPDPDNYVLAVVKTAPEQGKAEGWAVKDFAPLAALVAQFGEYLRLDFDVYKITAPDSGWVDTFGVQFVTAQPETIIADFFVGGGVDSETGPYGFQLLNGVEVLGPLWDSPAWNRYALFLNFASNYVSLYIGDEETPRQVVAFAKDYEAADIATIRFGSGIYYRPDHVHAHFFDNILLTANWVCPAGDVTGDCRVGLPDLAVMASTWLQGPYVAP